MFTGAATGLQIILKQEQQVRHGLSFKIFYFIMKFKNTGIYKLIYGHPRISISILVMAGISIIYFFVNFIITYVV